MLVVYLELAYYAILFQLPKIHKFFQVQFQ